MQALFFSLLPILVTCIKHLDIAHNKNNSTDIRWWIYAEKYAASNTGVVQITETSSVEKTKKGHDTSRDI